MCDKIYTNYTNSNNYNRASCAKQNYNNNNNNNNQQYYTYSNNYSNTNNEHYVTAQQQQQQYYYSNNNNFNNNTNNSNNTRNLCMYPNNTTDLTTTNWENRLINNNHNEDTIQLKMLEITSKDLSPTTSYCSNLDLYISNDFYKPSWYNNSNNNCNNQQKVVEYPACAQMSDLQQQQQQQQYYQYQINDNTYNIEQTNFVYNSNNYYQNVYNNQQLINIEQTNDDLSDESDIIVEDTDDTDFNDYNNHHHQQLTTTTITEFDKSCIICNIKYVPLEDTQFYLITRKTPLSMTTQQPIYIKLLQIFGRQLTTNHHLCNHCLNLINTIDHLQAKLVAIKRDLLTKFKKTNNNQTTTTTTKRRYKKKKKKTHNNNLINYKCRLCKKVLCLRDMCRLHVRQHKSSRYLCEICGKIAKTRQQFDLHKKQQHCAGMVAVAMVNPLKIDGYKCCNCTKVFRTKSNLKEHENYCLNRLPYKCKLCTNNNNNNNNIKGFTTITKLKNHIKLKHDKKFISICSICNIGFVKLSDYKSHKISHNTDKKYECNQCKKQYKTLSNLNFHKKSHQQQLPFLCTMCNKGFMRKEYLDAHINNHLGRKDFLCTVCNKRFVSQKNLYTHSKYHHNHDDDDDDDDDGNNNMKQCNLCGKMLNVNNYVEHLRIHNNLKEFECDQCDYRFNTKSTLAKHKKRKHANL